MKIIEKQKIADDLKSKFSKIVSVILTDYKGLDVDSLNLLRRKLRDVGVEFKVAKNSLLIRASGGTPVELLKDEFKGPSAVALCYGDPVAPAKILANFSSENNLFQIKAGVLSGKAIAPSDIIALASLPSREILLSQLVASMAAVPTYFVNALSGVPRGFVNVLQALKDKKDT